MVQWRILLALSVDGSEKAALASEVAFIGLKDSYTLTFDLGLDYMSLLWLL